MPEAARSLALAMVALFGGPAEARTLSDDNALARAIEADDLAAARALLVAGADPNQPLSYDARPLAWAVERQDGAMVELLLAHGAKANRADAEGLTPLALACERGDGAIVGQLLDARADVRKAGPEGTTPLAVCARFSNADTVARMLAMGAPPDSTDARGQTPLMWAASTGKAGTIKLLLAAGADVNRVSKGGFTPLFFAIKSGVPAATRTLLAAGADPKHRGPESTSAAQLAAYQDNYAALAMLAEPGVDVTERDRNGNQLLHEAAAGGDTAVAEILLAKGADPNGLTGPSRITWVTEANFGVPPPPVPPTPPLLSAAANGHAAVMKLLVEAGADPAFVARDGTNVVLAAARGRSAAALEYALGLAPDANIADANGATPLHLLVGDGVQPELTAMLRILADHGVRADVADKRGVTAAYMADNGLTEVKRAFNEVFSKPRGIPHAGHQAVTTGANAIAPRN